MYFPDLLLKSEHSVTVNFQEPYTHKGQTEAHLLD